MAEETDTSAKDGDGKAAASKDTAEPKPAYTFKDDGAFLSAVEKRSKGMINKAVEQARSELFTALGIENADEIAGLKERLVTTEKQVSEAEKLKAAHDKSTRELEKERRRSGDLNARLVKIAKRDALLPFVGQVVDPEVLTMLLDPLLDVDEEGQVSVKDGKALENVVEDLLKKRDYLRKPVAKEGAGTGATEPRKTSTSNDDKSTDSKSKDDKDGKGDGSNGQAKTYKTFGEAIVAELKAKNQLPSVGP